MASDDLQLRGWQSYGRAAHTQGNLGELDAGIESDEALAESDEPLLAGAGKASASLHAGCRARCSCGSGSTRHILRSSLLRTAPRAADWAQRQGFLAEFMDACLRGVAQIFFMNNPLSGALLVLAVFVADWYLGLCCLLGVVVSTSVAYMLRLNVSATRSGLVSPC